MILNKAVINIMTSDVGFRPCGDLFIYYYCLLLSCYIEETVFTVNNIFSVLVEIKYFYIFIVE